MSGSFFRTSIILVAVASSCLAILPLNKKPPLLELSGSCGGRLDGTPWSSGEIKGKVYAVYYIDPDEAEANEPLFTALKAENFPTEKVQSVAIINMKATWMPAAVLSMVLKSKQKKYYRTIYVKDNCRLPAKIWNLADHSSDILIFNARGEVIFSHDGPLSSGQINEVIGLIWKSIRGEDLDEGN